MLRPLASAAKAYIGEFGAELIQDCVQLHGGIGVTFEHDLHLYLRRHTVDRALFGTPAEHRRRIADDLAHQRASQPDRANQGAAS
jgi:alkylation response protein AidB-like acyl-CoA dehydrogenase